MITNFSLPLIFLAWNFTECTFSHQFTQFDGTLFYLRPTTEINQPSFFIYELNNCLYIGIKGSTDMLDYATDAEYNEITTEIGTFHAGFYNAAQFVLNISRPFIAAAKGPVYFTGHSYGASVGAVSVALSTAEFPKADINCIAFAPVPPMSDDANLTFGSKIVSFVNGVDMMPTLSIPNAYENFKFLFVLKPPRQIVIDIFEDILSGIEILDDPFTEEVFLSIKASIPAIVNGFYDTSDGHPSKVRFAPGRAYHIFSDKKVKLSESIIDVPNELNSLSVHVNSINYHLPHFYQDAILNIIPE